VSRTSVLE
jgi:hypothetical protein